MSLEILFPTLCYWQITKHIENARKLSPDQCFERGDSGLEPFTLEQVWALEFSRGELWGLICMLSSVLSWREKTSLDLARSVTVLVCHEYTASEGVERHVCVFLYVRIHWIVVNWIYQFHWLKFALFFDNWQLANTDSFITTLITNTHLLATCCTWHSNFIYM